MADAFGDEQHVAGVHDLDTHLGLPFQRALDAEDDLVRVDVAVPEPHVVLAALGDIDLDALGGIEAQRRAVRLVDIAGAELLGKHVDHAKDVAVLDHAGVDHRRLVMGENDILAVDGDELAIDRLGRLLLTALRLVHAFLLFQPSLSSHIRAKKAADEDECGLRSRPQAGPFRSAWKMAQKSACAGTAIRRALACCSATAMALPRMLIFRTGSICSAGSTSWCSIFAITDGIVRRSLPTTIMDSFAATSSASSRKRPRSSATSRRPAFSTRCRRVPP